MACPQRTALRGCPIARCAAPSRAAQRACAALLPPCCRGIGVCGANLIRQPDQNARGLRTQPVVRLAPRRLPRRAALGCRQALARGRRHPCTRQRGGHAQTCACRKQRGAWCAARRGALRAEPTARARQVCVWLAPWLTRGVRGAACRRVDHAPHGGGAAPHALGASPPAERAWHLFSQQLCASDGVCDELRVTSDRTAPFRPPRVHATHMRRRACALRQACLGRPATTHTRAASLYDVLLLAGVCWRTRFHAPRRARRRRRRRGSAEGADSAASASFGGMVTLQRADSTCADVARGVERQRTLAAAARTLACQCKAADQPAGGARLINFWRRATPLRRRRFCSFVGARLGTYFGRRCCCFSLRCA